jgi:hypothetical protein
MRSWAPYLYGTYVHGYYSIITINMGWVHFWKTFILLDKNFPSVFPTVNGFQ